MLRKITPFKSVLALALVLTSCQGAQDVVSESWLQKRKHRPGFHLNIAQLQRNTSKPSINAQAEQGSIAKLPRRKGELAIASTNLRDSIRSATWMIAEHGEQDQLHSAPHRTYLEKNEAPSLQATAVERTEELEELAQHQEVNKKKLLRSSGMLGLGLMALVSSSILSALPFILSVLLSVLGAHISLVSIALLSIHWIERKRLMKGSIFYTEQRIKDWTDFTVLMKKTQLVGTILSAVLGVVSIALTLSPALFMYGTMVKSIIFLLGLGTTIVTLLGISVGSSVSPYSFEAKRTARRLILLPLISAAIGIGLLSLVSLIPQLIF